MQLFLVVGEEFSAQDLRVFSQAHLRKLKLTLGVDCVCMCVCVCVCVWKGRRFPAREMP